jgi:hypothetical protein
MDDAKVYEVNDVSAYEDVDKDWNCPKNLDIWDDLNCLHLLHMGHVLDDCPTQELGRVKNMSKTIFCMGINYISRVW